MRRQGALRAQSSHNVCVFCASRLRGDTVPTVPPNQRRYLNSTRNTAQYASAAAATTPQQSPAPIGPDGGGWGRSPTFARPAAAKAPGLSEHELAERQRLLDKQAAVKRQQEQQLLEKQALIKRQQELHERIRIEKRAQQRYEEEQQEEQRRLKDERKEQARQFQQERQSRLSQGRHFLRASEREAMRPPPRPQERENRFKVNFHEREADGDNLSARPGQEAIPSTWQHLKPRSASIPTDSLPIRRVNGEGQTPFRSANTATQKQQQQPGAPRPRVGQFIRLVGQDPNEQPCPRCGVKGHFSQDCPSMGDPSHELNVFDLPDAQPRQRKEPVRAWARSDVTWQLDSAARRIANDEVKPKAEAPKITQAERAPAVAAIDDSQVTWKPTFSRVPIAPKAYEERSAPKLGSGDMGNVMWDASEDAEPKDTGLSSRLKDVDLEEDEEEDYSRGKSGKKAARRSRDEDEDDDYVRKPRRGSRYDEDEDNDFAPRHKKSAGEKRAKKKERKQDRAARQHQKQSDLVPIYLPDFISVSNLAAALNVRVSDFVRRMEELGFEEVGYDHLLNAENAGLIAMEYGFEPASDNQAQADEDLYPAPPPADLSILPTRPPVVTIMGHVDHGKTTILDFLRKSSVAASEFGGITQHIGAFSVPLSSGKSITFLDTPGHAAFESMRKRGADVTDIVVLVVAADDSVKPQTIEAMKHAQAAGVPMIVAINKIDKDEADPDKVKQDLARHGIVVEDYGGDTQVVELSGKTGQGMSDLEDAISIQSEILDHRAETDIPVEGWVLEGTTKKAGRVATVLVKRGTLHVGDILVAGQTWTRVRSLRNEAGQMVKEAGPGIPVEVDGWRDQAEAGDLVLQASNEQKATSVVAYRQDRAESIKLAKDTEAINEARRLEQEKREAEAAAAAAAKAGTIDQADQADTLREAAELKESQATSGRQEIPLIIKADVSGSVEAVVNALSSLGNAEIGTHILRSAVGSVTEFDIEHAAAASGHIASFNVTLEPRLRQMAEFMGVQVIEDNVIYRLSDKIKGMLQERLPEVVTQRVVGEAEIAQRFAINIGGRKTTDIAGCKVRNGSVSRSAKVRVIRKGETIYDGALSSLKNVKKDVQEMHKGTECGMAFEDWQGFELGDLVQCYEEKSTARTL